MNMNILTKFFSKSKALAQQWDVLAGLEIEIVTATSGQQHPEVVSTMSNR